MNREKNRGKAVYKRILTGLMAVALVLSMMPAVAAKAEEGTVSHTVTFKVVNGAWNDGKTEDKTETLSGDTLKLTADQIPAVGEKPNTDYKSGSWDTTPDTDTEISADTTYTYTYAQKESVSYKVTFKIVNGSWNDETTEEKTVTLSGYEGDTLKLATEQIPEVGAKPNETYRSGSWDATPDTETEIAEDMVYTYTYTKKETITPVVSIDGWKYGETANTPSVDGNIGNGEVTYSYAVSGSEEFSTTVPKDAGEYIVKAEIAETENYLSNEATAEFTITKADAEAKAPAACKLTYTGKAQDLVIAGTATGGTMQYSLDGKTWIETVPTGIDAATYTVSYKVVGDKNHNDIETKTITVSIAKAAATISKAPAAAKLTYNGKAQALVTAGTAAGGTIQYSLNGKDYGTSIPTGTNAGSYTVYYRVIGDGNHNDIAAKTATVIIEKAAAVLIKAPTAKKLTYTGKKQALVKAGKAEGGTIQYSLKKNGNYSKTIPKQKKCGTYTIYYKVVGDKNHNDTEVKTVKVTLKIPNPKVKIIKKSIKSRTLKGGKGVRYTFIYNIKYATGLQVKVKGESGADKTLKKKMGSTAKSNKKCNLEVSAPMMKKHNGKLTFLITALYEKVKSKTIAITK